MKKHLFPIMALLLMAVGSAVAQNETYRLDSIPLSWTVMVGGVDKSDSVTAYTAAEGPDTLGWLNIQEGASVELVPPAAVKLRVKSVALVGSSEQPATAANPLAPDFEDGSMPVGWTAYGTNAWYVDDEDYYGYAPAYAGTNSVYVDGNGHYDSDYLVSPALQFDGSAASISFAYATPAWDTDKNDLSVCYGTSPTGPWSYTSFVWVNSSSWTTVTVDLSSLNGTYYIAFESYDGFGYCTAIDNITFTGVTLATE